MKEPFLVNEPGRRRKPKGHRRGCRCVVCGRSRGRRRKKYKSNPGYLSLNPSRRGRRRGGSRKGHRGRYRRNPPGILSGITSALPKVGWGMIGHTTTALVPALLAKNFPDRFDKATAAPGYWLSKAGSAILGSVSVRMIAGRAAGEAVLVGGLLNLGGELVNQFVAEPMGLAEYLDQGPEFELPEEYVDAYLTEGEGMEYLSPGSLADFEEEGDEELPERLAPSRRF